MSKQKCWQDVTPGTVTFGASSREVKTGLWRSMRPVFDLDKCISCLKCWVQCPDLSVLTDNESKVCGVNLFYCKGCGICAETCPVKCIKLIQEDKFEAENKNHDYDEKGKTTTVIIDGRKPAGDKK